MDNTQKKKKITTLYFGEIEVSEDFIFQFPNGILGFDYLKDFVLISDEETEPFKWLISIDEPAIGFPLLSPWLVNLDYNPGKRYDTGNNVFFCIVILEDENHQMTINLRAPVILDPDTQKGEQIILSTDKYPTNFVINK